MIDVDPSGGVVTRVVAEVEGVDPWVLGPSWGPAVLMMGFGSERKGIEVCSGTGQFHSGNGGNFLFQPQRPYGRSPIHDAVVLRGGSELDVFCG